MFFFYIFQSLHLFRLTAELESHAAGLCLEALQHLTIALTGVDCCELFTLLVAFFGRGSDFQEDPFNYLDGAPKIRPPLDITDTDSDDESSAVVEEAVPSPQVALGASQVVISVPAPSAPSVPPPIQREPQVKSRPKVNYVDQVTDITMAQGFLPEDKDSLHNTGIPVAYAVCCSGSSGKGRRLYMCPFGDQCSSPPYASDIASTGSHIHCHHLGHCIQCPYDSSHFYNGTGWRDHMASKHEGAPWYHSHLGIDSQLPSTLFHATISMAASGSTVSTSIDPGNTQSTDPVEATIPISVPSAPDVTEVDTLEHVPNVGDNPLDDPDVKPAPPFNRPGIDIESLTVADLKEITRFLPSDLRQYRYFGGGHWLGHHRRDDSKTRFFAAELVSETKGTDLPEPEEGEDKLLHKQRKHEMHLFVKEHGGKIWWPHDPKDDPDGGMLTM